MTRKRTQRKCAHLEGLTQRARSRATQRHRPHAAAAPARAAHQPLVRAVCRFSHVVRGQAGSAANSLACALSLSTGSACLAMAAWWRRCASRTAAPNRQAARNRHAARCCATTSWAAHRSLAEQPCVFLLGCALPPKGLAGWQGEVKVHFAPGSLHCLPLQPPLRCHSCHDGGTARGWSTNFSTCLGCAGQSSRAR